MPFHSRRLELSPLWGLRAVTAAAPPPTLPSPAIGDPPHGPAAARSQWQLRTQTHSLCPERGLVVPVCAGAARPGGGAGAVRERPPCCGSCGGAGAPTGTASCPGSPSTSAASAGEAREKVPGASPDPLPLVGMVWGAAGAHSGLSLRSASALVAPWLS